MRKYRSVFLWVECPLAILVVIFVKKALTVFIDCHIVLKGPVKFGRFVTGYEKQFTQTQGASPQGMSDFRLLY